MTSLPVPLVVEMAISRAWLIFPWVLGHAFAQIQEGRGQFLQIGIRRLVLQFHDLGRVDHRPAAERNDLVRFVEIQGLHSLQHHLDLGFRIWNDQDVDVGLPEEGSAGQCPRGRTFSKEGFVIITVDCEWNWWTFSTALKLK